MSLRCGNASNVLCQFNVIYIEQKCKRRYVTQPQGRVKTLTICRVQIKDFNKFLLYIVTRCKQKI